MKQANPKKNSAEKPKIPPAVADVLLLQFLSRI